MNEQNGERSVVVRCRRSPPHSSVRTLTFPPQRRGLFPSFFLDIPASGGEPESDSRALAFFSVVFPFCPSGGFWLGLGLFRILWGNLGPDDRERAVCPEDEPGAVAVMLMASRSRVICGILSNSGLFRMPYGVDRSDD